MCLQFKQKIGPQQSQQPNPDDDDDDDDDDDNDTSAPSSTPEPAPPAASSTFAADATAAAVPSTSTGVSFKSAKKKASTQARDPDLVQLLLQHRERTQAVAGELCQLVTQAAVSTNNKLAWATFLHTNSGT